MNIKDYIASGILEQYALGLTSAAESEEVEKNVRQHPELLAELHAIQDTLLKYTAAYSRQPIHDIESRVLNKIDGPAQVPLPAKPIQRGSLVRPAVAIAGILLLALLGFLFFQNQQYKKALSASVADLEKIRTDCDQIKSANEKMAQYIATVGDAGNKPIVMKGLEKAPDALAIVHWNQVNKQAFIEIKNLPPAPAGKQYQLWVIVKGKPTDMGVFALEPGNNNLKSIPFVQHPEAFAVTLEDEGGRPVPTMDQMYLIGPV